MDPRARCRAKALVRCRAANIAQADRLAAWLLLHRSHHASHGPQAASTTTNEFGITPRLGLHERSAAPKLARASHPRAPTPEDQTHTKAMGHEDILRQLHAPPPAIPPPASRTAETVPISGVGWMEHEEPFDNVGIAHVIGKSEAARNQPSAGTSHVRHAGDERINRAEERTDDDAEATTTIGCRPRAPRQARRSEAGISQVDREWWGHAERSAGERY